MGINSAGRPTVDGRWVNNDPGDLRKAGRESVEADAQAQVQAGHTSQAVEGRHQRSVWEMIGGVLVEPACHRAHQRRTTDLPNQVDSSPGRPQPLLGGTVPPVHSPGCRPVNGCGEHGRHHRQQVGVLVEAKQRFVELWRLHSQQQEQVVQWHLRPDRHRDVAGHDGAHVLGGRQLVVALLA